MNTVKSVLSVMILSLAVVGCDSNSNNGGNAAPYPQPGVIGPYDQGQMPPEGQYGQPGQPQINQLTIQPGKYQATIRCENQVSQKQMQDVTIEISFKRDGTYVQDISSNDYRCRQNCLMVAEGSYSSNSGAVTLNQTSLINEYGNMLQGARNNNLRIESVVQNPKSRKNPDVVLRDGGTDNVCAGPFKMFLKKQTARSRR
ncbi:hypothetical protein [Bdellovibrio sp. GT3]|uniref:hypothetical protein n=1 Tax=Bdellovibrio sp. GT3 TaxID=3136282 RepID=UPI0030F038A1